MRVCLFSPSLDPLLGAAMSDRVRRLLGEGAHEVVKLTNSWADVPDGEDVYTTAAAHTMPMRIARQALAAGSGVASVAGQALAPFLRGSLLEALRAAEPDVIVCTTPAATAQLRAVLGTALHWPCISLDDTVPLGGSTLGRYDLTVTVSIVLPTYNGTRFLRESIDSCLQQTHRNIELIVVDDGSGAGIGDIVGGYQDSRLVFTRHTRNQGLAAGLNTGFRHSTGALCTWTSDDNTYLPDAIERMVRLIQTYPEVDFVYAESFRVDDTGVIDPRVVLRTKPPDSLARDNHIGACFLYKRAVYDAVGPYDPAAVLAEDYDYWVRVAKQFTMQRLFRRLYCYRYHEASLTARFDRAEIVRRVDRVRRAHQAEGTAWLR